MVAKQPSHWRYYGYSITARWANDNLSHLDTRRSGRCVSERNDYATAFRATKVRAEPIWRSIEISQPS